jgi:hypothetical protein
MVDQFSPVRVASSDPAFGRETVVLERVSRAVCKMRI